jgi:hypothetical protein
MKRYNNNQTVLFSVENTTRSALEKLELDLHKVRQEIKTLGAYVSYEQLLIKKRQRDKLIEKQKELKKQLDYFNK